MFSVIVPTMWKFKPFLDFVEDMVAHPLVGEVIIIDNNTPEKPQHRVLSHPKIKMYSFGINIFVNPAWNLGAEEAIFDRLCFLNDDLIFDLKVLYRLLPHISPIRGVFGISPGVKDTDQIPVTTGEINISHSPTMYNYRTHLGFGMLMFCHKVNWIPIIGGLNVYWGDNFIYDTQFLAMNQNYVISNMFHYTPYAATCSTLENANDMLLRENVVYNRDMPAILEKIRVENNYKTGF